MSRTSSAGPRIAGPASIDPQSPELVKPMDVDTLVEMLQQRALRRPGRRAYTFLEDGERESASYTFAELDRKARAIAAHLLRHCEPGDRALLIYPAGLDYMAAFFGCLYAGVIAVPVYPPDPARLNRSLPRLKVIAQDADSHIALTVSPFVPMGEALSKQNSDFAGITWIATDVMPDHLADSWVEPAIHRHTLAFLQYTSGSTADPKGVMVTHDNLLYNLWDMSATWHARDGEGRLVTWLPAFHDMGLIFGLLLPVYLDFPCYVMSPMAFLQHPVRWLRAISNYKATHSVAPNFGFDLCTRKVTPEQRAGLDLTSWQVAGNGSEPIRPETLERFAETFKPCGFTWKAFGPGYGLAEATLKVSVTHTNDDPVFLPVLADELERHRVVEATKPGDNVRTLVSCGNTALETRVLIVDPQSCLQCSPDTVGEIWVAGPTVAQGYWRRPETTEAIFNARLADTGEGPFLRTGDLGFVKNGHLYVTGRIKDMIIIDGANHYPQDIEVTVEKCHPAIRPGCVIAFSVDDNRQERLVVVAEAGIATGDSESKQVAAAVRKAVAENHDLRVHKVCLIAPRSITKTSSGKLQRQACRAAFLDGTLELLAIE